MKLLNTSQKEQIATIIRDEAGKIPPKSRDRAFTHVAPHIEHKVAERAAGAFGAGAKPEDVLFLISSAIWKIGAKGIFLTDSGIYKSADGEDEPKHIDYPSVYSVEMSTSESSPVLYINEEQFFVGLDKLSIKLIADILVAIQRNISSDFAGIRIKARLEIIEAMKKDELISNAEYQEIRSALMELLKHT